VYRRGRRVARQLCRCTGVVSAASHSQRTEKIVKSHPALLLYDGEMDHKMMAHEMTPKERSSKRREKRDFCRCRI